MSSDVLYFAVPSGRIEECLKPLFNDLGLSPVKESESRKLVSACEDFPDIFRVDVKPADVPAFVAAGRVPVGVCGPDVWEENHSNFFSSIDSVLTLPGGPLRFSVIGRKNERKAFEGLVNALDSERSTSFTVGIKYPLLTKDFFENLALNQSTRVALEIIKLNGKVELAPLIMGLCATDLIETGNTLRANGLEEIRQIKSWEGYNLLVNKKWQDHPRVKTLVSMFEKHMGNYIYNADRKKLVLTTELLNGAPVFSTSSAWPTFGHAGISYT